MSDDVTPLTAEEIANTTLWETLSMVDGRYNEWAGPVVARIRATIDALQARLATAEAVVEAAKESGVAWRSQRLTDAIAAYDATRTKETTK